MAILTGTGELDFRNLDNVNEVSFFGFLLANGADVPLAFGLSSINFIGPFSSGSTGFDAEDSITRIELDTGAGVNGVIDNIGLTDFDYAQTLVSGTIHDAVAFALHGDDMFNLAPTNDWVDGFEGHDDIRAGGGDDTVQGSEGNDTLRGGPGSDKLDGGSGDDSLLGQAGTDEVLGGSGDDTLKGGGDADIMGGGTGDDFLKGGTGTDVMLGGSGNDRMFGNADMDQLFGGRGNDSLNGGGGDDVLIGGRGDDTMKGGAGSDVFFFAKPHGDDLILDFDATDDNEDINFTSNNDFNNFGDVQAAMQQVGDDVVITTSNNSSITLRDVDISDLDANDFVF